MNFYYSYSVNCYLYGSFTRVVGYYPLFTGIVYNYGKVKIYKNFPFQYRMSDNTNRMPKKFKKYIESNLWLLDIQKDDWYKI